MRRHWYALLVLPIVLWPATPLAADKAADREAERDFRQYCGQCHGHDGRGQGPNAYRLATRPADLTLISRRRGGVFPTMELAAYIDGRAEYLESGPRSMPAWGRHFSAEFGDGVVSEELAKGKLLRIVDYLRSIQR